MTKVILTVSPYQADTKTTHQLNNITLSPLASYRFPILGPSEVRLNVERTDIEDFIQVGDDLLLIFQGGGQIALEGFFIEGASRFSSRIFLTGPSEVPSYEANFYSGLLTTLSGSAALGAGILALSSEGSDPGFEVRRPFAPLIGISNGQELSGTAEAGTEVSLYDVKGAVIASTGADWRTGEYRFSPNPISDGATGYLIATDAAGNTSDPATVAQVDATAPPLPTIDISNAQGLQGVAEPGSTVSLFNAQNEILGTTTADPLSGEYLFSPNPFSDGETGYLIATDAAGNTSDPATVAQVDATVPLLPTIDISNAQGLQGIAEPGSTVSLFNAQNEILGTTTADPLSGEYLFSPNPFSDGETGYLIATDAAGNTSEPATVAPVDATAPLIAITTLAMEDDVVNASEIKSVVIAGTTDAKNGQVVKLVFSDSSKNELNAFAEVSNGTWSMRDAPADLTNLNDGIIDVSVSVYDTAGNKSATAQKQLVLDSVPPSSPSVPTGYIDSEGSSVGFFPGDTITDDARPELIVGRDLLDKPNLYVNSVFVDSIYNTATGTLVPLADFADGNYKFAYSLTDAAGNESALSPFLNLTIASNPPEIIDISNDDGFFGFLTSPVQILVNGSARTFYFWDRTEANDASDTDNLNNKFNHDEIDSIFNSGTDTNDSLEARSIILTSGVEIRLPTINGLNGFPGVTYNEGTIFSVENNNQSRYDGLLSIWDAYNGSQEGIGHSGVPPGWATGTYWSSTSTGPNAHAALSLPLGLSLSMSDLESYYVGVEVIF